MPKTVLTPSGIATPVIVANGGTGVASLTAYAVICGGTTSTGAVQSIAGVGTSGQVLTSNGAGALPTFQAAATGAVPQMTITDLYFGTSSRYTLTVTGGGVTTFGGSPNINTSNTATSSAVLNWTDNGNQLYDYFLANSNFTDIINVDFQPTTGDSYWGIGLCSVDGTGHTYTTKHYGFKIVYSASVATVSATNGNGTTETASTIAGLTITNAIQYHAKYTLSTNIKFYTDKTLQATQSTNMPSAYAGSTIHQFSVSNRSTATRFQLSIGNTCFNMDAE